jgi:HNH endonuclease
MNIVADEKWYLNQDGRRKLTPHCPLAANDKCPRYYVSLQHAAAAGVATLDLSDETRTQIEVMWAASDAFASPDLSVGSWPAKDGSLRGITEFCPEVSARIFGLYCSSLRKFVDEDALHSAHKILNEENVPKSDLRWSWSIAEPRHYTECNEYSVYRNGKASISSPMKTKKRTLPPKVRFAVFARDNSRCVYCGRTSDESKLHVDHKVSVNDGGTNLMENLVTACEECNLGKGAMSIRDNLSAL